MTMDEEGVQKWRRMGVKAAKEAVKSKVKSTSFKSTCKAAEGGSEPDRAKEKVESNGLSDEH